MAARRRGTTGAADHVLDRRYAIGFCVLLAVAALGGGSARGDVLSLVFVRPAAAVFIAACLLTLPADQLRQLRFPMLAVGAAALAVAAQLVPLPPGLWAALPGHAPYDPAALGLAQVWRPLSLTPDLTLNTLLSLLPPAAAVIGVAAMRRAAPVWIPRALVLAIAVSAFLGLMQLAAPPGSPLRFYAITSEGFAVGLFANRNHEAVFIAIGMPMLAAWCAGLSERRDTAAWAPWIAVAGGAALLVTVLVTASRAGIVLAALAIPLSVLLYRRSAAPRDPRAATLPPRARRAIVAAALLLAVLLVALIARSSGVGRLLGTEVGQEERVAWLGPLTAMLRAFLPLGTGFGAFSTVYRRFEPFALLDTTYLNAAHNDLLQLLIEAGVVGALLLAAYLVWWARAAWRIWRSEERGARLAAGRAASIATAMLLIASLFDYPLRTPLLGMVFAAASMLMRAAAASAIALYHDARSR